MLTQEKTALITGITGQDGWYLAHLLLTKGYRVTGLYRRVSHRSCEQFAPFFQQFPEQFSLHEGDITDSLALLRMLHEVAPHEIYHLAAQSDVASSFATPLATLSTNILGTAALLEAVRISDPHRTTTFYQASSSEMFGHVHETPQSESTPFRPRSPYAISKVAAFWSAVQYREAYHMFVCNGILFNHESPRRGPSFVTQKIVAAVARTMHGITAPPLELGNLNARRDWGYAGEYVEAMWRMLQHHTPDDYVIATGRMTTVRALVEIAYAQAGITIQWKGTGIHEIGVDADTGNVLVRVNPRYFRPAEVEQLCGDATKAFRVLNWQATVPLEETMRLMLGTAAATYTMPTTSQITAHITPSSGNEL